MMYFSNSMKLKKISIINDQSIGLEFTITYKGLRDNFRASEESHLSISFPRRFFNVDDSYKLVFFLTEELFKHLDETLEKNKDGYKELSHEHKFRHVFNLAGLAIASKFYDMREKYMTEEEPTPIEMDRYYVFRGMPDGYSSRDVRNREEEQSKHDRTVEWLRKNGLLYKASEFGLV